MIFDDSSLQLADSSRGSMYTFRCIRVDHTAIPSWDVLVCSCSLLESYCGARRLRVYFKLRTGR